MTAHKRWDIERSRNKFSPHYLEHEDWKWGDYGAHPMDKYLRPGRIPHIWCSACGLGIAMTCFIGALEESGINLDSNCVVSGIGCTGRIAGYLKLDSYHTTHGRPIPFATGLKLGNPELTVTVFSGDGDLFAIGGNHFIHAARRNVDINVFCVNNFNYGMTGGQVGPTTHLKAKTTTSPYGNFEAAFNLPHVAIASGAVYVARWTTLHARRLKSAMVEALQKKGFCFIEIIAPCPTAYGRRNRLGTGLNEMKYYREHSVIKHDADPAEAELVLGGDILCGKFKDEEKPTFLDMHREGILDVVSKRVGGGK
jgi:2-oxoglutarate ferredoxin oxidoreductase subunit beta